MPFVENSASLEIPKFSLDKWLLLLWISWVDLVWLASSTVRLKVSDYSQLSDYNWPEWLVKNEAAYAPIMVMIN